MTRWLDPHPVNIPASSADVSTRLSASLNLSRLIAQTLPRRGINSPEEAEAFLHPDAIPPTPFPNIEPAVKRIVSEFLAVVGKIRQRIIDLADHKILAIIQACDGLGLGSHTPKLFGFSPVRQLLSLVKTFNLP